MFHNVAFNPCRGSCVIYSVLVHAGVPHICMITNYQKTIYCSYLQKENWIKVQVVREFRDCLKFCSLFLEVLVK